jgi:hypothetical protein
MQTLQAKPQGSNMKIDMSLNHDGLDTLPGQGPVPMVKMPNNGPIFDIQPRKNPLLWDKQANVLTQEKQ